jgi:CheY-like chemotaxis protein
VTAEPTAASNLRALVLEDEENLRDLIGEMLLICGCEADLASGGTEALGLLADRSYDLILVDYLLPGMDGRAFFNRLKQRRPDQVDRVVFMTGADPEAEPLREFLEECGRPALRKPFGISHLDVLVQERRLRTPA